jgi:hypothetical protein
MTADVLGMPVDTLNMIRGGLLGPAQAGNPSARALGGLLGPVQQTGSGDWFAQQMGLPQGEGMAYEAARMLSPSPTDVMGLVRRAPIQEIMTYHGSPKTFDAFDSEKVSGKRGRSQYGFGTYVTESKDVAAKYAGPKGGVYQADLPDAMAAKMLDFEKDITEQPKNVQDAIKKIAKNYGMSAYDGDLKYKRAANFMADLSEALGKKQTAAGPSFSKESSEILKNYGVPGVKYMTDISVSSAGKKSAPSYVLFPGEEKKVKILKRE